ncbi:hypothetical protein ACFZAT_17375 [Streptomyces sp. NPDC008163]|uniref:hypothetical protein n=1 Tax=Streptomyces sp. NPDC008163 TaxID=3364818 RepID=UPI0036EAF95C
MTGNPLKDEGPAGTEGAGDFRRLPAATPRAAEQRDRAEERAVAAFREARDRGAHSARTRRRDDWRPRSRGFARWSLGAGVGTLVAAVTLGGVAMAGIGTVRDAPGHDTERQPMPELSASSPPALPTPERVRPSAGSSTPSRAPGRPADHPDQAGDTLAKCHAFASVRSRGKALDSPAWQRFLAQAGGESSVDAYCAAERARHEGGDGKGSSGSQGGASDGTATHGRSDAHRKGAPSPKPGKGKHPQ